MIFFCEMRSVLKFLQTSIDFLNFGLINCYRSGNLKKKDYFMYNFNVRLSPYKCTHLITHEVYLLPFFIWLQHGYSLKRDLLDATSLFFPTLDFLLSI